MRPLLLFTLSVILLLSGCSTLVPVPEVADVPPGAAKEAWGKVLATYVDSEGRVNFSGLGKNLSDLQLYVRYVSKVKPGDLPSEPERLAFYLNAYNAISMYNVIKSDYPHDFDGFFKRLRFFYNKKFIVMGEEMSPYAFENDVIRKVGDPRVHVALNCMSASCPRLPREPFDGGRLNAQLEREATKFYNEERNVSTDAAKKVVHVSEILKFFTDDFLKKAPTLIAYINKYRKEKVPADYSVEFIPYNWTVYKQPNT